MDFAAIDWQRPWLAPLRECGTALAGQPDWKKAASLRARQQGLCNASGQPIVFVPQHELPDGASYEAHIHATGNVPTRDNLHDFFNALMWLHFPLTKRTLNQLQAAEIHQRMALSASSGIRGGQRDAATLFDENAALFLVTQTSLVDALRQHQWNQLLLKDPGEFASACQVLLFGHALLEKLVHPYKAITAHVWCMVVGPDDLAAASNCSLSSLDRQLASELGRGFASRDFCHLPVLGVPGWWPGQDEAFYGDAAVFRPPKPDKGKGSSVR